MKIIKQFNKDGQPTLRRFRVYCSISDWKPKTKCDKHIIGKWGGGYGCITTEEGRFDARNQVWVCDNHTKEVSRL